LRQKLRFAIITAMAKELCKQKKGLKNDIAAYALLVHQPTHLCKKCGRAGNSKKLLCSPKRINV
jgi:hypothetical protein